MAGIHAEAYPSAEFRHGPLSMIDEKEKTPGKYWNLVKLLCLVIFIALHDDHFNQVLNNIRQVKTRGARTIVMTNVVRLEDHINIEENCDFVINIGQGEEIDVMAGLRCLLPLQMIVRYTAHANGLDIDDQMNQAIAF